MTDSLTNYCAHILAIETATSSCSVALYCKSHTFELTELGTNVHSQVLLTMVQQVLEQANIAITDLAAIAVGQGPGSFTGLRIGIGVAQGLAYGVGCPMIGVSSLDALANQAENKGHVLAAIDARMHEVYWGVYNKDEHGVTRLGELRVTPPEQVMPRNINGQYQLVGNAWSEYADSFDCQLMNRSTVIDAQRYPSANSLLELAQTLFANNEVVLPADFTPQYVRNDVAKKSAKVEP